MIMDNAPEKPASFYLKLVVIIFSGATALGLLIWSLANYQPTPTFYGPRAIYGIVILSVVLAVAGRFLLLRLLKTEIRGSDVVHSHLYAAWRMLFLFDVTAPISLAAGVLIGPPAAVLTALISLPAQCGQSAGSYRNVDRKVIRNGSPILGGRIGGKSQSGPRPPALHVRFAPLSRLTRS